MIDWIREMLSRLPAWFVLFGTFLPVLGSLAVLGLASVSSGRVRWWILFMGPLVVGAAAWICAPVVMNNGNLLAAVVFFAYALALVAYYPVLLLVAAGAAARSRRAETASLNAAPRH